MTDAFYPANGHKLKTPFWTPQQKEAFDRSCDLPRFFYAMEPRTGKSMPTVVTADYQYQNPRSPLHVTGMLVVAYPNGAHVGWVKDAFPESFTRPWRGFIWSTPKSGLVSYQREFRDFLRYKGFKVLSVYAEALISDDTKIAIGQFMVSCSRIMAVADEVGFMRDENSRRAKTMFSIANSPYTIMKRALDGTPVGRKGSLDYFAEIGFLGFDILGYDNRIEFDRHYAEFENKGRAEYWSKVRQIKKEREEELVAAGKPRGEARLIAKEAAERLAKGAVVNGKRLRKGRDFWSVQAVDDDGMPKFRNVDELWRRLDPIMMRATFAECFPDAARHVFVKRYFEMTPEQEEVYRQIEKEHVAEVDGVIIDGAHHLTRILRLQQVSSNFYPDPKRLRIHERCGGNGCEGCEDGVIEESGDVKLIGKVNPRLEAYADSLREGKQTIAWARFDYEIDEMVKIAHDLGFKPAQYDGRISPDDKLRNREAFQAGDVNPIIGKGTSMSRGIRLDRAEKQIAVSNIYSFFTRQQMEGRSEHGNKKSATVWEDIVGRDTVDETHIIPALRLGLSVSEYINRDKSRQWI